MIIEFAGQSITLLPDGLVWIEVHKTLIIADFHLDKAAHFRRNGLPVPNLEGGKLMEVLVRIFQQFHPKCLIVLGDLVHTDPGIEFYHFLETTSQIPECHLITGNHDKKLSESYFPPHWHFSRFLHWHGITLHHGDQHLESLDYSICGHWHPGFALKMEFQKQAFPAFILKNNKQLVLPAFGKFTGLNTRIAEKGDDAFIIHSLKVWLFKV